MIYAIIVAGGSGTRMNSNVPKQFLTLNNKPVILYSIEQFLVSFPLIQLIVVLPKAYMEMGNQIFKSSNHSNKIRVVEGGETRYHSVKNGLECIHDDGIVFIHDAVRPCIDHDLLTRLYNKAIETGNAIPCVDLNDSIRCIENGKSKSVDRQNYKSIQTPQTFKIELIKKAFQQEYQPTFTDEATVLESMGETISLVDGISQNIKITRQEDLELVSILLSKKYRTIH